MNDLKRISLADYDIVFDKSLSALHDFLEDRSYSNLIILTDDITRKLCLPVLISFLPSLSEAPVISVPSGEQNKTLATCEEIWADMLRAKADRNAVVINLGGGVIGDMGGFAAACYKRGVDFIQIPTTVLSQVDSSIGGKLGVDFRYGKNLIGVFKNPALVLISTKFLESLPSRQIVNGFAEVFKHALIKDAQQWSALRGLDVLASDGLDEVLYQSLLVKKAVVEADPFEKGLRKILNFGHTIGHAVEAYSLQHDADPLLHGEAVAAGMIMEAWLGSQQCNLPEDVLKDIIQVLSKHYPHYSIAEDAFAEIWASMALDKKNAGSKVLAVSLRDIAQPVIDLEITPELLKAALAFYKTLA
jgi:3-dehydroquinate synthase